MNDYLKKSTRTLMCRQKSFFAYLNYDIEFFMGMTCIFWGMSIIHDGLVFLSQSSVLWYPAYVTTTTGMLLVFSVCFGRCFMRRLSIFINIIFWIVYVTVSIHYYLYIKTMPIVNILLPFIATSVMIVAYIRLGHYCRKVKEKNSKCKKQSSSP